MIANIVPTLRYRNAPRMLEWLVEAFGFKRHAVHEDGKGGIAHAQLTLGAGMIMLSSARDDEFGKFQKTPAALGGTTRASSSKRSALTASSQDPFTPRVSSCTSEI